MPALRPSRNGASADGYDEVCVRGQEQVSVQPMVVSGVSDSGPLVVHLFGDAEEQRGSGGGLQPRAGRGKAGAPLTERELEVLRYLALGWDVPTIARELGLSPHTVRNHSTNLRRKLDVRSSLEAVMTAVRLGVLTFDGVDQEVGASSSA